MDDRIRSDAVSPDWRRGLLWASQARIGRAWPGFTRKTRISRSLQL